VVAYSRKIFGGWDDHNQLTFRNEIILRLATGSCPTSLFVDNFPIATMRELVERVSVRNKLTANTSRPMIMHLFSFAPT
jgi:hypothetical protein